MSNVDLTMTALKAFKACYPDRYILQIQYLFLSDSEETRLNPSVKSVYIDCEGEKGAVQRFKYTKDERKNCYEGCPQAIIDKNGDYCSCVRQRTIWACNLGQTEGPQKGCDRWYNSWEDENHPKIIEGLAKVTALIKDLKELTE
jgi:hypothetical protein